MRYKDMEVPDDWIRTCTLDVHPSAATWQSNVDFMVGEPAYEHYIKAWREEAERQSRMVEGNSDKWLSLLTEGKGDGLDEC